MDKYLLDTIETLINELLSLYLTVSEKWRQNEEYLSFNQKRVQVCDVIECLKSVNDIQLEVLKNQYIDNILKYKGFLNYYFLESQTVDFESVFKDLNLSSRVKFTNSIINKLYYYGNQKKEKGKVSLNKCLNDLMGYRIIINQDIDFEDLFYELNDKYQGEKNIRIIKSFRGDYKAIHLYFKLSNQFYSWELQIWLKKYERSNLESHKIHKQSYKNWEIFYKESE